MIENAGVKRIRWAIAVAGLCLPGACGSQSRDQNVAGVAMEEGTMGSVAQDAAKEAPHFARVIPPPPAQPAPPQVLTLPDNLVIKTGSAQIKVETLDAAVTAVRSMAQRLGGMVGNVSMVTGSEQVRQAILEVKVPAARFEEALNGLGAVGEVETVNVEAMDVGEEYVDVNARVANGRKLEERLLGLLQNRTGKLEEVLAVERELARVREEIDRGEGRLRYLRSRIALSTLSITIHEPHPILSGSPGQNILLSSFVHAWRNFVQFVAGLIAALGVIVPVALLLFGALWMLKRVWRRRVAVPQ